MHILFVDDSRLWQKIALLKLPTIGCTVAVASDGQQALDYLSAPPEKWPRPDLIMMDIAMPVLGGLDATRIIRTQPPFATDPKICSTPIVGLCATSVRRSHERFRAQGMDDIIVKPWKVEQIQPLLRWWAQRRVVPRAMVGGGGVVQRSAMNHKWPHPWAAYRGPRSRI
ncbi:CheY-like superfamily [Aspergillus granulosus]|uniref:CheY-like superfamily n=1 Tax=Aspergillus granulosus TaxID=176169 RepID=A0ABR4I2V1_9EURO